VDHFPSGAPTHANDVFAHCCVQFSIGNVITLSEVRTRALLDGGTTMFTEECGAVSQQERSVLADPAIGALTRPFKVWFVERLEGPDGRLRGSSTGPSCAQLGAGPMLGVFQVAQGADLRTMPHEFAHYLMSVRAEHSVQTSNIQHISTGATGDEVTSLQCDIMCTRALVESI
jgi:hypothetical protein